MKLYVFTLLKENAVYAYTLNKAYAKQFRKQRNMDLFREEVISITEMEFSMFSNSHRDYQMEKDFLYDGTHTIDMVVTVQERNRLDETIEQIEVTKDYYKANYHKYPLKEKYRKMIQTILSSFEEKQSDGLLTANFDTFKIFYRLCKNTFIEDEKPGW